MKQELTIAVALLAIGLLLWFSGSGSSFPSQQASQQAGNVEQLVEQRVSTEPIASSYFQSAQKDGIRIASDQQAVSEPENAIVQASFQKLAPGSASQTSNPSLPSIAAAPPTTGKYLHTNSNPVSIELLAGVAEEIANSKPFALQLSLEAHVFERQIVASGNYYQQGQGSDKTKIELSFDHLPGQPKMLQLCDGRFVYTIHSTGGSTDAAGTVIPSVRSLEFVDLLRVKEAARETASETAIANPGIVSPTGWVATGGIASLLQHLASGFNFGPPEPIDSNSDRIRIRGGWDEDALRGVVADLDKKLDLGSPIQWDKVPRHIPHAIELVLSRSSNQSYFPSQISFLRFSVKDHQAMIEPSLSLTFSAPKPLTNLAEGFFVVDSSNLEPTDATDRYIARIESFHQTRRSNVQQIATQREPPIDILTK